MHTINNYHVEVLITLAVVAVGTALATELHTSESLAMVMTGLLVGHFSQRGLVMSDESQDYVDKFWELIDEVLNALLFVLMGLEILVLHISRAMLLTGGVAVAVQLGMLRVASTFRMSLRSITMLSWADQRGGLAVALVLSLPASMPR